MDKAACEAGTVITDVPCPASVPSQTPLQAPQASNDLRKVVVRESESVVLHCDVTGSPVPSIRWAKNDVSNDLKNSSMPDVTISEDNRSLTIHSASAEHIGKYECIAVNEHGHAVIPFQISLQGKNILEI